MVRPIKSTLRRHSIKKSGTKTGLSKPGISLARRSAQKVLSGKVKGYSSPVSRAENTLKLGLGTYRSKGGKTYPSIRVRKELGLGAAIRDEIAAEKLLVKHGEPKFLRLWLDGKVSQKIIASPKEVADNIIKKRFGLSQKIAKAGAKEIMLDNLTHSWLVEAVFERLTNTKFNNLKPGTMVRETEGLVISHYKNGKAVLRYRNKSFDVTQKLESILKN
jgi:hypothetical protein